MKKSRPYPEGKADQLPEPIPYRNLVAQARLGMSQEEHEAFFRQMLSDVTEPTAPFGMLDVHGDGSAYSGIQAGSGSQTCQSGSENRPESWV